MYRFSRSLLVPRYAAVVYYFWCWYSGVWCESLSFRGVGLWAVSINSFKPSPPPGWYSVSDLPSVGLCWVGDGDLSYASQTGRSTTDIQSNGWTKYRRVRQKRKQINMIGRVLSCASNCAALCIITFRGILLAIAYRSSYLCCNCESTTAVSYNFSRSLLMDISIESRSATRGMLA